MRPFCRVINVIGSEKAGFEWTLLGVILLITSVICYGHFILCQYQKLVVRNRLCENLTKDCTILPLKRFWEEVSCNREMTIVSTFQVFFKKALGS